MKKRGLIAGLILVVIAAAATVLVLTLGGGGSRVAGDVRVPINAEGAANLGSVSIVLTYSPAVLEIVDVKAGEMAENAMLEYEAAVPGRVRIGMIDSSGITGDGAIVMVGFDIVGDGTTALVLETVETHDATTLVDIVNEATGGSYAAPGGLLTAPTVRFFD